MEQELRIGFVSIQDATDVGQWSGIPAHVLSSLRQLPVHLELYSPLNQRKKYLLTPIKLLSKVRKSSISLDHYPLMLNSYASQISAYLEKRPVDVILATSSIPVTAVACAQPIVFWTDAVFHGMFDYYDGAFASMPASAVARGKHQEEASLANCTFAVYSSEWAASNARKLTDPRKVQVIPFGASFSIEQTRSDVEQWARQRRELRPGSCELLFIGVNWERKGGAIAVETARILNESGVPTRLTVVGCEPPQPLPDYVRSLGFISKGSMEGQSLLKTLLREADFFILPTIAEAAGVVFCEASAFGLPALSYATGGVPDYVRTGINGFCLPAGTPASGFAEAIRGVLHDSKGYEALCLSAFSEYQGRLNWETSAQSLVALCRRAIEEKRTGRR
ncbi:MAG TPA: glycosyltransferase family 4 protein [Acidisarcina sp.]